MILINTYIYVRYTNQRATIYNNVSLMLGI